jgi:hypothetical protein
MPLRTLLAVLLLAAALPAPALSACEGEAGEDRLVRIEETGDLVAASGRTLSLADLRLDPAAAGHLSAFAGEAVAITLFGGPDRWSRIPARIVVARTGQDLASWLLDRGLAVVDIGERSDVCRPSLIGLETEPRRQKRGAWASWPLPADEPEALAARVGQFAVVEGRVVSVGERARWTYLNFGRDFARDFSVSISRRNWQAMRDAGLSADALTGRTVRVRGILDRRRAPGMEVTSAAMIEPLGEARQVRPPRR